MGGGSSDLLTLPLSQSRLGSLQLLRQETPMSPNVSSEPQPTFVIMGYPESRFCKPSEKTLNESRRQRCSFAEHVDKNPSLPSRKPQSSILRPE